MRLLRTGIVVAVAGTSLVLGGGIGQASGTSTASITAGLTFGLTGTMPMPARVEALLRDARTLQTRMEARVRGQITASKNMWEQTAASGACVGGGTSCISGSHVVGDVTVGLVVQLGFTDTNGGAPLTAAGICERIHVTPSGNGTATVAGTEAGPSLVAQGIADATSSGQVQMINAGPASTTAVAADASALSTGESALQPPTDGMANASMRVTGGDITNNVQGRFRGGALNLTLSGYVSTQALENGTVTGNPTIVPGSVSCALKGGALLSQALNVLAPTGVR